MVSHQFFECNPALCVLRGSAFLILDLTFQGHSLFSRVRGERQSPCSGSLVCLWRQPSVANHIDATVEVVVARSQIVLPGCAIHWAHVRPDLCGKEGCARIACLGQLPAAMV